jgi:hypothetical protein
MSNDLVEAARVLTDKLFPEFRRRRIAKWRRENILAGLAMPCTVCGEWEGFTDAHHVYPLSEQAKDGRKEADHEVVWLCPNHHRLVHRMIKRHFSLADMPNGCSFEQFMQCARLYQQSIQHIYGTYQEEGEDA